MWCIIYFPVRGKDLPLSEDMQEQNLIYFCSKAISVFDLKKDVENRAGTGTWDRPGSMGISPQHSTRKGRVLGQLWYLPVSTTILIDLKLDTWKKCWKFCSHEKFAVVEDTYSKPLSLWITSLVMQVFSGTFLRGSEPDSTRTWYYLNTRYPTSTWFFIPVPPLVENILTLQAE